MDIVVNIFAYRFFLIQYPLPIFIIAYEFSIPVNSNQDLILASAPIDNLLNSSSKHYQKRRLKKALNNAQIAYDFATKADRKADSIRAALLLAQIYNTNGKYLGDTNFFPKAIKYIHETATAPETILTPSIRFQVELISGQIQQNLEQFQLANEHFQQALAIAEEEKVITEKVLALTALSQLYILLNQFSKALEYTEEALDILNEKDDKLLAEIYSQFGQIYIKKQEYSKSLEYSQYLLVISKRLKDTEKEITALNNIAIVSGVKTNYKIAIQYFLEALNKSKAIGYRHNIAHCLINIGTIYAHLYNYEEALDRYQIVLTKYQDILDDNTRVIIYNNVGNIHYTNEQPEDAKAYFTQAYDLAQQCNYQEMVAHSLAQLSRTETALGDFDNALKTAQEARIIIDKLGTLNGRQINLINLGDIYFREESYQEALNLTQEGLEVAIQLKDHTSEIRGYQLLALIFEKLGKYKLAFEYQLKYSQRKEEFAKIQNNKRFLHFEIKYAIKEKQKEIEQLTKENEFQSILLSKSDQIARQNEELLQMNEELRQFAYVASHDLKEPLRMIGSYTQLINRLYASKLDGDSDVYFNFITEGVARMNNLLDALLKYATIGHSEEEEKEINLNDVVEICKVNLRVLLAETETDIQIGELPTVYSTYSLLTQLIQNLLSNAIKFRQPDQKSVIKIQATENLEEHIISVNDNGIGISEEYLERIFVIFQRLHARTKYQGTGIGLSICQKIVKRLGGRIWVESVVDEGSTFYFSLPKQDME